MSNGVFSVATLYLKKQIKQPRTWCFIIILAIFLDCTIGGIRELLIQYDVRVPIFGLVAVLIADARVHCPLLIIFALLMCDLPGWDNSEPYVILRSGRKAWVRGKMLCVVLLCVVYWLTVVVISALVVGPISFDNEWGQALRTLAETSADSVYGVNILVSQKVLALYTPTSAFVLSMALNIAFCIFGGLWALVINFATDRPVGGILITAFALLDRAIGGLMISEAFYRYSPASMASLAIIDQGYWTVRPTFTYALLFFAIGIVVPIGVMSFFADRLAIKTVSVN